MVKSKVSAIVDLTDVPIHEPVGIVAILAHLYYFSQMTTIPAGVLIVYESLS